MTASSRPPRWAALIAFAVPALLASLCAGNSMGWYDSPELAAAGGGLGVTHPPGHPLWSALAALCSMLPLGALPLRIALGQALCLATTGLIAMHCAHALYLRCAGPHGARLAPFAAVAASLIGTLGTGAFRQATRVEVYALAGLVAVLLLALALDVDRSSRVRLREAGLVLGVGLANHHFIAITAAPLVGWIAWETWRESGATRRGRALLTAVAFVCIGLTVYVLLPLRADAPASIARVRSLGDWIDVASARVFAKNTGAGVPGTAGVRALDVLDWLGGSLTPLGLLFAAGGFYVALRDRSARGSALRLLTLIAVVAAARGWLGFVRDNPDAAGYLLPALVALGISSAAFVAGSIRALAEAPPPPKGPTRPARAVLTALLVGGPLLLPLVLAPRSVSASRIDRSAAPATLTASIVSQLPPRAVLFAYDPQTVFRTRYAMLVEGERPDVTVVDVPLLAYPGMLDSLLARDRALAPLVTEYLLRPDRGISPRGLSSLALARPVAIELDPRNIRQNVAQLLPRGPIAQAMPEPTTLAAVRGAAAAHFARNDQIAALVANDDAAQPLADEALLWRYYTDALFFAARGARPEARRSLANALRIAPNATHLSLLREALATPGEGPIDVAPFLTEEGR